MPFAPFVMRYFSRSFKYNENKIGDKFSPCLTPLQQGKKAELPSGVTTLDFMLLYIFFFIKFRHFPFMLYFCSLYHSRLAKHCQTPA